MFKTEQMADELAATLERARQDASTLRELCFASTTERDALRKALAALVKAAEVMIEATGESDTPNFDTCAPMLMEPLAAAREALGRTRL
jgi:hypothetical protein